jgi:hypothetical protein
VAGYRLDDRGSIAGRDKGLFSTAFGPTLWPTHPPLQWMLDPLSPSVVMVGGGGGVSGQGIEADHSLQSSAEVKNVWSYISSPHMSSLRRA